MKFIHSKRLMQKVGALLFFSLMTSLPGVFAIKYKWDNGAVSFTIPAPVGQLLAVNEEISGSIDAETGAMHFNVVVRGFHFVTSVMPDYINESTTKRFREYYLETATFPQASFEGKIVNLKNINFLKEGIYEVTVMGIMSIHGKKQAMEKPASITVKGGKIMLQSDLTIQLNDYNIPVPEAISAVFFKEVAIHIVAQLKP